MSTKTDIWMPVYVGDYLADTSHLSTEQHGAYMLLLMHSWRTGPLPSEPETLRRISRLDPDVWSSAWSVLGPFFKEDGQGFLIQKRLEEERIKSDQRKAKASAKASKAAKARYHRPAPTDAPSTAPSTAWGNQQALLETCPSPSPAPSQKRQQHQPADAERCDEFFRAWNEDCGPELPKVLKLGTARRTKLRSRLGEDLTMERWREAIRLCKATPFLRGEGDRGWTANFDWLVENDSHVAEVLEQKFGRPATPAKPERPSLIEPKDLYEGPEYQRKAVNQ